MHRPITLWRPSRTEGSQGSSPPPNIPPPYQAHTTFLDGSADDTLKYIPSLKFFCIRKLLEYPDEVYRLGTTRIHSQPPESLQEFDLLRALMPSFRHQGQEDSITAEDYFQFDLTTVDPRLWAILIQLLDNVPDSLRIYRLSLCDAHLPLLQQIPSTPTFSLVTILELGGRSEVTDDTITELGRLNGLGALDLSRTSISSWGIIRLCKMLKLSEPESNEEGPRLKGPWGLRVLYLKDCMNIKEDVLGGLNKFPLLSVVDLRGTPCEPTALHPPEGTFQSSVSQELFHPTSLFDVLQKLSDRIKKGSETYPAHLFPSHDPFFLHIADLNYTIPSANRQATLRSLLDNLRNYGTPTSVSSSPPLDIRNIGRMSTVAAVEARRHASVQSSNAFYAQIPQTTRKRGRLPTWNDEGPPRKAARSVPGANRNDVDQSPNPLMLYRPPPCWDMLQIAAMRVQVSRGEKKPPSKIVGVLHGEGARKKLKVRESIQSVWNLIERRKTVGDTAPFLPESRTTTATGANPFSRKISKVHRIGDLDPSLKASVVNENGKDKAPEKGTGREEFERSTVARSTFVLPPRSTKPLQPISTLAVPSLPLSMRAKPKPPPPPLRKSRSTGGAQTTLRSHFKESERDARKRQVGEVGPSNSIYSTKGFEEKSKKEKKRKTGGGGFDWGTWSGTPR